MAISPLLSISHPDLTLLSGLKIPKPPLMALTVPLIVASLAVNAPESVTLNGEFSIWDDELMPFVASAPPQNTAESSSAGLLIPEV